MKIQFYLVAVILHSYVGMAMGETFFKNSVSGELETRADYTNCTSVGPVCTSCKTLSYCYDLGDGDFLSSHIMDCGWGETCNKDLLLCSSSLNYECDIKNKENIFTCYSIGLFPDPFNCQRYHMCVPRDDKNVMPELKSRMITCPKNFAFDPNTLTCSIDLTQTGGKCIGTLVPRCYSLQTKDVVSRYPSFYYVCLKTPMSATYPDYYYPQIFRCPNNQQYINKVCQTPKTLGPSAPSSCQEKLKYFEEWRKYIINIVEQIKAVRPFPPLPFLNTTISTNKTAA